MMNLSTGPHCRSRKSDIKTTPASTSWSRECIQTGWTEWTARLRSSESLIPDTIHLILVRYVMFEPIGTVLRTLSSSTATVTDDTIYANCRPAASGLKRSGSCPRVANLPQTVASMLQNPESEHLRCGPIFASTNHPPRSFPLYDAGFRCATLALTDLCNIISSCSQRPLIQYQ